MRTKNLLFANKLHILKRGGEKHFVISFSSSLNKLMEYAFFRSRIGRKNYAFENMVYFEGFK